MYVVCVTIQVRPEHVDAFMKALGSRASKNLNLAEFITYGAYLAEVKNGDDLEKTLEPYMGNAEIPARLAAISYYYEAGTKDDLPKIQPFESDSTKIPTECDEDAGCDWTCLVGEEGKKEPKEIKTVGEFVSHCIKPKMLKNKPPEPDKKKGGK